MLSDRRKGMCWIIMQNERLRIHVLFRIGVLVLSAVFIQMSGFSGQVRAEDGNRLKIGLALSGGGAKGCAHIGVLKFLEELNVPVDYIAGTSMGAVIGGLYASGIPARELEKIILTMDWEDVMNDKPQRKYLTFRRKEDDQRYLFDLELGIKGLKVEMPTGLRFGQKFMFLLRSLTLPVTDITDFDKLPIPFRAVATNIGNGEPVVLGHGDLVEALRASMAIPGVFSPVAKDGMLLIDGGVANNIPVDVVKSMGADIIIAVDISSQLADLNELKSFFSISIQTIDLLTRKNMEPRLAQADLVITPPVAKFGTMEFKAAKQIIELGYNEARKHKHVLQQYSIPLSVHEKHTETQTASSDKAFKVDSVRFSGNKRVSSKSIQEMLHVRPGKKVDIRLLSDDINHIFGLGEFQSVYYTIAHENGRSILDIHAKEKPWGPHYLHFGLMLSSDLDDKNGFSLLINMTNTCLNQWGAEWRSDLVIGLNKKLFSEFYQPLNYSGIFFMAPSVAYQKENIYAISEQDEKSEFTDRRFTGRFDLGMLIGRSCEIRLGYEYRYDKFHHVIGAANDSMDDVNTGLLAGRIRIDRLDSVGIPTNGLYFSSRFLFSRADLGSDISYNKFQAELLQFKSHKNHTLFGSVSAGMSPGSELPVYNEFRIGGMFSFSGYDEQGLHGDKFGIVRLGYYYHLDNFDYGISSKIYVGGWVAVGDVLRYGENIDWSDLLYSTTAFLGADSILGPVYLGYSITKDGDNRIYLNLGKKF